MRGQQELDLFSGGNVINTLMIVFFLTNTASHFTRLFTLWLVILVIPLSLAKPNNQEHKVREIITAMDYDFFKHF